MSNEIYSFTIEKLDVLKRKDGTDIVVIRGIAVDGADYDGNEFDLLINGQPVDYRVRHLSSPRNSALARQYPNQKYTGFILRAELPESNLGSLSLAFHGRTPKTFSREDLAELTNDTGLICNVDFYYDVKDIISIGGWLIGFNDRDQLNVAIVDGNGKTFRVKTDYTSRLDVVRSYFALKERVVGFAISIQDSHKIVKPLSLRITNGKQEWTIPLKKTSALSQSFGGLLDGKISRGMNYLRTNGVGPFLSKVATHTANMAKSPKLSRMVFKLSGKNADFNDLYNEYFLKHRTSKEELERQRHVQFEKNPKISLIVAAYNTPIDLLEKMIDSVREQTYTNWQLCIADGSSKDNNKVEEWLKAHPDPKISWCRLEKNLGISGNMNAAADLATGDMIALYDHDDFLEPDCLFEVVKAANEKDYDFVYTDEDKYEDESGRYVGPNFKPDFSPALLRSTNYICHFLAIRKDVWDKVGGSLQSKYDGAQDYDLVLRLMDVCDPANIKHIPRVLYHWRMCEGSTALAADSKKWAYTAGERALRAWARRNGLDVGLMRNSTPGQYHLRYPTPGNPLISIIIPSKDHIDDLRIAVEPLMELSKYRNFEVIVVENNSTEAKTFEGYKDLQAKYPNLRIITWEHPFNYSAINNFGVKEAKGDYLLFLNNDTEIVDEYLLDELLGQAMLPNVGAVGAKLYFEDGTVQHNGVIIGHSGVAGHGMIGQPEGCDNYRMRTLFNASAVTAACMMVPRHVFDEVGGFNEDLAVAYNDIDFCLRIRSHGYEIVQNPFAMMYHYESKTRGYEDSPEKKKRFENEVRRMYSLWPDELRTEDPYYNPNYDLTSITYQLRKDDEVNPYINPDFLGEDYYTAGTVRPKRPENK